MLKPALICILFVGLLLNLSSAQISFPSDYYTTVQNFGRCTTPNRERANCIYLEDCKYLYNLLLSNPLQDSDKQYLTRSQCGYQNNRVLICCPDRYREVVPLTTTPKPVIKPASDLLPQPGVCGNALSDRIYGGKETNIDEFPWMALIEYSKPGGIIGHHCGGSLINDRYVVTASHCVNGVGIPTDWRLTGVRLGEWNTTMNPDCEVDVRGQRDCAPPHIDVAVEQVIPHPDYKPSSKNQINDIALLRLARRVEYTDFVRPICLPLKTNLRSATFNGIPMDVAGWGKTEKVSASTVKLKASVQGNSLEDCRNVYGPRNIHLEESQMCAGGVEGVDSCRGDSGGPLISLDTTNRALYYYFLAGVVSFGPTPCGLANWPGVYTRVGSFVDWIQDNLRQ